MRNFKISIDFSDLYLELVDLYMKEYTHPFMLVFVEAEDPDDACFKVLSRIIQIILNNGKTIENRILCRKLKNKLRIEKIYSL
jgi:RNAse (barnase) inhibitor barstar